MSGRTFKRGELQAIVADAMVKNNIRANAKPKPETKAKAAADAQKALGDKDPKRSLQILNYLLRNGYRPTVVASRLEELRPKRKAARRQATAQNQESVAA